MLFENMVGIEKACELVIVEELKLEEENNLFAKFPIGTTMQDDGKRKEVMTSMSTFSTFLTFNENYCYLIPVYSLSRLCNLITNTLNFKNLSF